MFGQKILFSKHSDEWRTPPQIIERLREKYNIKVDLACTEENAITDTWKCLQLDELSVKVAKGLINGREIAYCNPPYSKCTKFVKLIYESRIPCILLLPARTDTRWFHDFIYQKENVRIQFLKGRLKFSGAKYNAPFPSMLVYMNLECSDQ